MGRGAVWLHSFTFRDLAASQNAFAPQRRPRLSASLRYVDFNIIITIVILSCGHKSTSCSLDPLPEFIVVRDHGVLVLG